MNKLYAGLLGLLLVQLSCTTPNRKIANDPTAVVVKTSYPKIIEDTPYRDKKLKKTMTLNDEVSTSVMALIKPLLTARVAKKMDDFKKANPKKKLKKQEKADLIKDDVAWANDLVTRASTRMSEYFLFLGLNASNFSASNPLTPAAAPATDAVTEPSPVASSDPESADSGDDGDNTPSNLKAVKRLFAGSTQFLFCDDLTDLDCLEKNPEVTPSQAFRLPKRDDLGVGINAGKSLDMDVYFTQAWDGKTPPSGLVNRLAEKLHQDVGKSLSIAMYGIDDITGTMKPVYDAIHDYAQNPNINVRSVVDVSGFEKPIQPTEPWIFSYTAIPDQTDRWLFGKSEKNPHGMHATFEYDGTPNFIDDLNVNAKSAEDARVRIEWPKTNIMHNKYAVLENSAGQKSVWSGTANISNHCMGSERNANMSVYLRNDTIAQAYLDEFNMMFNYDSTVSSANSLVVNSDPSHPFLVGRFHHNKYPVSKRLFNFDDGTRVRVHFAPTDDAEHRVILPMLLSAKEGDQIRISMFGGTGYELIRAMQFAAAKGASVKIVFDSMLSKGPTSWLRDPNLNLTMSNPYLDKVQRIGPPGKIEVRISTWVGKNHYKAGTLTRHQPDGSSIVEELIVGSQNWSSGGNDANDENLLSIQNLKTDVPAAVLFNKEFDNHLWLVAR